MKQIFLSLILALPCVFSSQTFAQNMIQPAPTPQPVPMPEQYQAPSMNQMKQNDTQSYTMEMREPKIETPKKVQLQIEIPDEDVQEFAISKTAIQNEIASRLQLAQIQITNEPNVAKLILRVKSIQADRAVATFVQMGFFEEAQLKRNKGSIMALTWSQATLISGPQEDINKEILQLVTSMTNAFILDYHKAMMS